MKCDIKIFLLVALFPFFLSSQIWKYPPSPFQYHHSIDLNDDIVNRKGIKSMSINVYIENDTLNAYTKYDTKGRIIEYKSEYDEDTIFYSYKKGLLWSATKYGRSENKVKRIIKYHKDAIISIQTNFPSRIDISRFYYDDKMNIIKAIHNDTIIEDFGFNDMKLISYSKTISGVMKEKMTFSYGLDTVFYSNYIFPNNQEHLVEEIYGIFKNDHLTEITTKESYGGNNVLSKKYYFQYDSSGKLIKSWEEYLSGDNGYEQSRYTETFSYDKNGQLIKRELISKTENPRTLCDYFYVYY